MSHNGRMAAVSYHASLRSPLGWLGIQLSGGALAAIDFLPARARLDTIPGHARLAREAVEQLEQYFSDPTHRFTLPLALADTDFRQRVWRALTKIPSGEVRTYGQLARRLRSAPRAVGGACRVNPIPIIVPCHRVIAATGPGGYMGATGGPSLRIKQWLLQHERNQ